MAAKRRRRRSRLGSLPQEHISGADHQLDMARDKMNEAMGAKDCNVRHAKLIDALIFSSMAACEATHSGNSELKRKAYALRADARIKMLKGCK